jgi:hypothetical protein
VRWALGQGLKASVSPVVTPTPPPQKDKPGTAGGDRAGKSFTPKGKREVVGERARETGGNPSCADCEKDTNNPKKTERGDRRDPRERNVDHIIDRARVAMVHHRTAPFGALSATSKNLRGNQMTKKKMTFFLEKDEDGYPPDDSETVWVEKLEGNRYRIDNIPFYIRGISPEDIVTSRVVDGNLIFDELISKSTISVFRIVFLIIQRRRGSFPNSL